MYREDKTTQMAASFLKLANGRMPYIKLLKMLYIADKQMLTQHGFPITYDRWVAMKHGPVLSTTYDLMKPNTPSVYWARHIRTEGYDVVLSDDPGSGDLSLAEDRIVAQVFAEFGRHTNKAIIRATHELPEWEDPGSTSTDIPYEEVLRIEGLDQEDIEAILENIEMQDDISRDLVSL